MRDAPRTRLVLPVRDGFGVSDQLGARRVRCLPAPALRCPPTVKYADIMASPPGLTRENNPGNARWCEEHRRLECTKGRTKGRGDCHKLAVRGTDGCDMHSGFSRPVLK